MENTEKIADLKKRMQNKSLPESAKVKLQEMIDKLEGNDKQLYVAVHESKDGYWTIASKPTDKETAKELSKSAPKNEIGKVVTLEEANAHKKVVGEEYLTGNAKDLKKKSKTLKEKLKEENKKNSDKSKSQKNILSFEADVISELEEMGEMTYGDASGMLMVTTNENIMEQAFEDGKSAKETAKKILGIEDEPKKTDDYDCDKIIADLKARKAKQKQASKKADNTPAIKKDEKAIDKIGDRIKKHYKEGELSKKDIVLLIREFTDKLNELKELLKTAPEEMKEGGNVDNTRSFSEKAESHMKQLGFSKKTIEGAYIYPPQKDMPTGRVYYNVGSENQMYIDGDKLFFSKTKNQAEGFSK